MISRMGNTDIEIIKNNDEAICLRIPYYEDFMKSLLHGNQHTIRRYMIKIPVYLYANCNDRYSDTYVKGSWDGWNGKKSLYQTMDDNLNHYSTKLYLQPGEYYYKFCTEKYNYSSSSSSTSTSTSSASSASSNYFLNPDYLVFDDTDSPYQNHKLKIVKTNGTYVVDYYVKNNNNNQLHYYDRFQSIYREKFPEIQNQQRIYDNFDAEKEKNDKLMEEFKLLSNELCDVLEQIREVRKETVGYIEEISDKALLIHSMN
eukprot:TRINITY_DN1228_c2_g1_i5.p1 TRINITY_DN1228_c2_g1~~TRINITY_DN1228_c2_g1_i5.p1  ORF type:complete len:258 (-),score=46.02 TRINITY_DN1228_c2_g1_i5:46-819(-)